MENEKVTAVLNDIIVNKLESISFDIKYYINVNAGIAQSMGVEGTTFKFMTDEEINELIEIRKKTKQLAFKLKNRLNDK
jgi:hypothetical protein